MRDKLSEMMLIEKVFSMRQLEGRVSERVRPARHTASIRAILRAKGF